MDSDVRVSSGEEPFSIKTPEVDISNATAGEKGSFNTWLVVGMTTGPIVAVIVSCILIYKCIKFREARKQNGIASDKRRMLSQIKGSLPDVFIIPGQNLRIEKLIGQGQFGDVFEGVLKNISQDRRSTPTYQKVAAKSIQGDIEYQLLHSFLEECSAMKDLDHPNILRLLGVCIDSIYVTGPLILTPFMKNKDLKTYLKLRNPYIQIPSNEELQPVRLPELVSLSHQICRGLEYLSRHNIVHRDLAARNCMLNDNMEVKIADFGMARHLGESQYYRQTRMALIPVKWMAPESLLARLFSDKSDVWAFGVTVWEILSYGMEPYSGINNGDMTECLKRGHRLSQPDSCPDNLFKILENCWQWNASDRPDSLNILAMMELECSL